MSSRLSSKKTLRLQTLCLVVVLLFLLRMGTNETGYSYYPSSKPELPTIPLPGMKPTKNNVLSLKTNPTEKYNRISYLESELGHVHDEMIINNRQFCTKESLNPFFSRLSTVESQQARFSNCACSNSFHFSNSSPKPPLLGCPEALLPNQSLTHSQTLTMATIIILIMISQLMHRVKHTTLLESF